MFMIIRSRNSQETLMGLSRRVDRNCSLPTIPSCFDIKHISHSGPGILLTIRSHSWYLLQYRFKMKAHNTNRPPRTDQNTKENIWDGREKLDNEGIDLPQVVPYRAESASHVSPHDSPRIGRSRIVFYNVSVCSLHFWETKTPLFKQHMTKAINK